MIDGRSLTHSFPLVSCVSFVSSCECRRRPGTRRAAGSVPPPSCRPPSTSSAISTTPCARPHRAPSGARRRRRRCRRCCRRWPSTPTATSATGRWSCSPASTIRAPRTRCASRSSSPNDRLRTVAYASSSTTPTARWRRIPCRARQGAGRIRPSGAGSCAGRAGGDAAGAEAADTIARARQALVRDVSRGEDFFRSAVIEALGDYKAPYAFDALTAVAKLDGPLQDDAALALGKIGDKRALETLAAIQRTAPREAQPAIADGHLPARRELRVARALPRRHAEVLGQERGLPGTPARRRGRPRRPGVAGHDEAVEALFEVGIPARRFDAGARRARARDGGSAQHAADVVRSLQAHRSRTAIALLAEGFDLLEEDLEKERFFAVVRRTYWDAADGSPTRLLMQSLIGKLDF